MRPTWRLRLRRFPGRGFAGVIVLSASILCAAELPKNVEKLSPAEKVDAYLAVVEDARQLPLKRNYAAAQIVELGEQAVPRIMQLYRDGAPERRGCLAGMLGAMKKPGEPAVQMLLEDLRRRGPTVHPNVIKALGDLECAEAAPPLLKLLPKASDSVRPTVLYALGRLADEQAADALFEGFDTSDRLVRTVSANGVIRLLVKLKAEKDASRPKSPYRKVLKRTLEYIESGKRDEVRRVLLSGIGGVQDLRSTTVLRRVLRTGAEPLRIAAARALGELKDQRAVDSLTEVFLSDKPALRRAALQALAAIGDKSCVPTLIDRLEVSELRERRDIVRTLQQLTKQSFGDNPDQWLRWWKAVQDPARR